MHANSALISVGEFKLKPKHLIIVAILAIAFSVAFLVRAQGAEYGLELNEFDPFFNYRATLYAVDNGVEAYYNWHDNMSWYPNGRDVSRTSQVVLHLSAALTYPIFGGGMSVYDYTILFPTVFGALTAIVMFALVRVVGGTTAGLFAALLYSVSLPILVRGPIGWFKSEPLGLFLGILALYLLLSGLYAKKRPWEAIIRLASAGLVTSAAISAWGGNVFLIFVIAIFFLALPFMRTDHRFLIWTVPLYTIASLISSFAFERGLSSISFAGAALALPAAFVVVSIIIQMKSRRHKVRNTLFFLTAIFVAIIGFMIVNGEGDIVPLPAFRYLNAINPFLTTTDPLVDSVSEHATTTLEQSFTFHSVLMIFSGIGIWLIIKGVQSGKSGFIKNDMLAFSLILGMFGVYISSTFVRLEVFAAIAVILLSSLCLSILTKEFIGRGSIFSRGRAEQSEIIVTVNTQKSVESVVDGENSNGVVTSREGGGGGGETKNTYSPSNKKTSGHVRTRTKRSHVRTPPQNTSRPVRTGGRRKISWAHSTCLLYCRYCHTIANSVNIPRKWLCRSLFNDKVAAHHTQWWYISWCCIQ